MSKESNVAAAARQFEIDGEFLEARPYGSGHINDTYRVIFREGGAPHCHILQRINHNIFKRPVALMENIQRVTAHLAAQVADEPDSEPARAQADSGAGRTRLACGCGGQPLARLSLY